ncbi:helix-turn-helix domain-containing protein [Ferruginibacter sp. SUN106]|uniref:helix-turn-helix domain-containing protein n=1 Tax=Ferruginibacter sp. SUN106 TaxID=2978348 RepID=UPI003D36039F
MILKEFLPDPAFRDFVRWYRIVHFEFDKNAAQPFKAFPPKPEVCLHFFLREGEAVALLNSPKKDHQFPMVLTGQQTSVMNRYSGRNFLNFQVVFQPTGLHLLTGIPAEELTNKYIDATTVLPGNIRFTYDALQHATNYAAMLLIADSYIAELVKKQKKQVHLLDAVSKLMLRNDSNGTLDWLAKESCLCTKQFKRKFNERTGVNPKTYARIVRFTKAFNTKNAFPQFDWLRIALECGYFDYQHLVKDYKDFTGLTPVELHLLENNSPESRLGLTGELYKNRHSMQAL